MRSFLITTMRSTTFGSAVRLTSCNRFSSDFVNWNLLEFICIVFPPCVQIVAKILRCSYIIRHECSNHSSLDPYILAPLRLYYVCSTYLCHHLSPFRSSLSF